MTTSTDRRRRWIANATLLVAAVGAALWLRSGSSRNDNRDHVVNGKRVAASTATSQRTARLPRPARTSEARPGEEERKLPEGWENTVRSWSSESVPMRRPAPHEEAPVQAHRFTPDEQPPAAQPPNPFVPAKAHLSEDDLRAGLAAE